MCMQCDVLCEGANDTAMCCCGLTILWFFDEDFEFNIANQL